MKGSPLRRLVSTLGLLALLPIGYLLVIGELTVPEAATRAGILLGAVVAVNAIARFGVTLMANSMDRQAAMVIPKRRATDR